MHRRSCLIPIIKLTIYLRSLWIHQRIFLLVMLEEAEMIYNIINTDTQKWARACQNKQNDLCAHQRLRSIWASVQSDQSLLHEEDLDPWLSLEHTAKTLIRLGGCPGWSESLLGAQLILLVLSCSGSNSLHIESTHKKRDLRVQMWSFNAPIVAIPYGQNANPLAEAYSNFINCVCEKETL